MLGCSIGAFFALMSPNFSSVGELSLKLFFYYEFGKSPSCFAADSSTCLVRGIEVSEIVVEFFEEVFYLFHAAVIWVINSVGYSELNLARASGALSACMFCVPSLAS